VPDIDWMITDLVGDFTEGNEEREGGTDWSADRRNPGQITLYELRFTIIASPT
jgi:hypothetical protein